MVKGSSKSMEEVTRVSHFVGSSGRESEREIERGEGGQYVRREGHTGDQRGDLQLRLRPLTQSATKAGHSHSP